MAGFCTKGQNNAFVTRRETTNMSMQSSRTLWAMSAIKSEMWMRFEQRPNCLRHDDTRQSTQAPVDTAMYVVKIKGARKFPATDKCRLTTHHTRCLPAFPIDNHRHPHRRKVAVDGDTSSSSTSFSLLRPASEAVSLPFHRVELYNKRKSRRCRCTG